MLVVSLAVYSFMLEHSPCSSARSDLSIDFELGICIDKCPIQIRPERTPRGVFVSWGCGRCACHEVLSASQSWSTEMLVIPAKMKAGEHMMRTHPGPETRSIFENCDSFALRGRD